MISIRAHLLGTLLPAFAGISLLAGFGVYYSTKAELEARLDARLAGIAVDLRFTAPQQGRDAIRNRLVKPTDRDAKRTRFNARTNAGRGKVGPGQISETLLTNLPSNVYCEIWLGNRSTSYKSDNLLGDEIARPAAFGDDPVFYDATLPDGLRLRAWASRISMMRDTRQPKVILAIDRNEVDKTLARLARNLVGGGVACCLALSLLLIASLRSSLRPLRKLGEQAATMDAESLDLRFSEKSTPSDIRPIVGRLNDLMAKLEEGFARERRFSGDLAHELRTPLAAIRTTAEVATKWPEQASAEDFGEILRISSNLQQTLDSLLLLARMESSTAEKNIEAVNPAKMAEESMALHASRAEERNVKVDPSLDSQLEIQTDPRLLRIIMTNLIGNAVEYAPEGSTIHIRVGSDTLFQCLNEASDLTSEDVAHLFERMWRKDKARTESGHAGLGLSIAKVCADALNLAISAELNPSQALCISLHSY